MYYLYMSKYYVLFEFSANEYDNLNTFENIYSNSEVNTNFTFQVSLI